MSTSNIRINTYKYSCHCRGQAEGDVQPLNNKRPAKSKADVILDTVTKFLVSHCGKETDWFYDKEDKWKKKLSDLAQGKGQSFLFSFSAVIQLTVVASLHRADVFRVRLRNAARMRCSRSLEQTEMFESITLVTR